MKFAIAAILLIQLAASEACQVSGFSSGWNQFPTETSLNLCGNKYTPFDQDPKRGIAVMIFDPDTCSVTEKRTFDTWGDVNAPGAFQKYVEGIAAGTPIILATSDEFTNRLNDVQKSMLVDMGSPQDVNGHEYRSSLIIFTKKMHGGWCPIAAGYQPPKGGQANAHASLADMAAFSKCRVSSSSRGWTDVDCGEGYGNDNCAQLDLCGSDYIPFNENILVGSKRGIAVTYFDHVSCSVTAGETFDTYRWAGRAAAFEDYVNAIPDGYTVILTTADEFTRAMSSTNIDLLRAMGSPQTDAAHEFRSSLVIVARKVDGQWCHIAADYKAPGMGPASVTRSIAEMAGEKC